LHFEVAVIKAIQTLSQATLDDVIERLGELRDGKGSARVARAAADVSSAATKTAPRDAKQHGRDAPATATATGPDELRDSDADVAPASTTPRVAERANPEVNPEKIWQQAYDKIPLQKAFVRNSAAAAHVVGVDGRNFILGFAPDQRPTMDILGTTGNRKLIETLLQEVSGRDWTLKLSVKDNLPTKEPPAKKSETENFKDDPLIQEALEMFKGKIRT
jgi:hypothetical protein